MDEMYTHELDKKHRIYVFTAVAITDMGYQQVYARVYRSVSNSSLIKFLRTLPKSRYYYSDEAPMYGSVLKSKVLTEKNVWTNLVESLNSQLRHYVSQLVRKTKAYSKSIESLQHTLDMLLSLKFNKMVKVEHRALLE